MGDVRLCYVNVVVVVIRCVVCNEFISSLIVKKFALRMVAVGTYDFSL